MENENTEKIDGAFFESLTRTGKKIRADRAEELYDGAYVSYKREIEDLEMEIKGLKRQRTNMLDLSPTTVTSLQLAADFDPKDFAMKDLKMSVDLRNLKIKLTVAKDRFEFLFGKGE